METKHILAILDPSLEKNPAARRAITQARQSGARLTMAVFEDHQTIVESGLMGDALTRQAIDGWQSEVENWLDEVVSGLDSEGVSVDTKVVIGHPLADQILETIEAGDYDLVIKDSHDESFLSRAFFTPLDWHLLRRCPIPLMLAKADSGDSPKRIAAAVDPFHERGKPAELDRRILATAKSLAELYGAELHVIHACQTQPLGANSPLEGPSLEFEKVRDEITRHHTRALHELSEEFQISQDRSHFLDAPARRAIADFTREQSVDLLVMGTVTRKGLTRLIMGSTAEAILGRLECDVLAIKPEGFPNKA
ncbi:universal stress protein E [Natronospira proteinivora]|uniref:Universal stress protein E n=1 Tax=Natronospira proteinivora TaxID=1807133 RepID=A0ABT1GCD1_9GAMM|nr:universal stress protein [Natronospira proteinivora]MCP1728028.1 universal stress protein E [Natronospira proteinivora]